MGPGWLVIALMHGLNPGAQVCGGCADGGLVQVTDTCPAKPCLAERVCRSGGVVQRFLRIQLRQPLGKPASGVMP